MRAVSRVVISINYVTEDEKRPYEAKAPNVDKRQKITK